MLLFHLHTPYIDQILNHDRFSFSPYEKQEIISVDKYIYICYLVASFNFLWKIFQRFGSPDQGCSKANELQRILSSVTRTWTAKLKFKYHQLTRNIMPRIDSITGDVMSSCDSPSPSTTHKEDIMIGFDGNVGRQSWNLLLQKVFDGPSCPPELERRLRDCPLQLSSLQLY